MGVRSMMATILKRELETRGIRLLRADECQEIIQRLLEQLADLELSLPAREISEMRESGARELMRHYSLPKAAGLGTSWCLLCP
jgi:hypothetical protein